MRVAIPFAQLALPGYRLGQRTLDPLEVERRLSQSEVHGRTIMLKVTYSDLTKVTRSTTLEVPYETSDVLHEMALQLLEATDAARRPVRLLGITVSSLDGEEEQREVGPTANR